VRDATAACNDDDAARDPTRVDVARKPRVQALETFGIESDLARLDFDLQFRNCCHALLLCFSSSDLDGC
jgi:hypothetical protein